MSNARQRVLASASFANPANSAAFLPPVAFDQDPAVTALFPAMRNPDRARMRRADPMAVDPDVAVAVPAVIAVDPDPSVMRRTIVSFDDGRGRRNANDNLRQSGRRSQTKSKQQ